MTLADEFRARLEAERAQTSRRVAILTGEFDAVVAASLDTNADDEHDPEGATIAFERSQVAALIRQARESLEEVEVAVRRLDEGTYGRCQRCGSTIDADRLRARPVARHCMRCATAGRS